MQVKIDSDVEELSPSNSIKYYKIKDLGKK
jgi:hypothetical protein